MKLVKLTHPALRNKAKRVVTFDTSLASLVNDMVACMADNKGVGLAAPQIGISKRIIVIYANGFAFPMINPEITWVSDEVECEREGCLSFPGVFVNVERPKFIEVKFQNTRGKLTVMRPPGPKVCRIIQHETDHLNGVLFTD